ncbi:EAL domain-containing protein [Wohlfahrtiimonas larvae]|uniref:EAL domain-containing protein n=1 Tax=Wohlfahrtiimonas larvae TaxID=1157986 RepID=A0ABP9MIE7_9GAMM|nr:EAL domain-containing protein [Wohlfahrtiimonas larvae]
MGNEIYKILYVENNAEKVTQLRQLIRANTIDGKITFDVSTTDSVDGISAAVNKDHCDLVILQDSPKVPILKEVHQAIGVKDIPVLVLVNEEQFLEKRQAMIQEGALDVGILQQGDVLFKQIVRAIFELKTQLGYRDTLEKNARLTELTEQFASSSEDLIAYFGAEDGIFLYANDAFLQYFGYKEFSDLAATTVLEYVASEQSSQFKKMMKIVGRTGKEQAENLSLKHPNGALIVEDVILKQGMYEEISCIELFVSRGSENSTVSDVGLLEDQPLSEQAKFYDRLSFINNLTNFVGSSSWLVSLVLQDYFDFRKRYGVEALESYFLSLSKHLGAQINNLHYARYSDESIVLLLTNSDMTKVDRLGMAIVSSSEGYAYQNENVSIQGKFTFAYTNLGDSVASISDACSRLDELAGLFDARVVFTDDENEADAHVSATSDSVEQGSDGVDEEFMPLFLSLKKQQIKQSYIPVVDFSMKGQENYIASFNLYDDAGELSVWNKSFTYTSNIALMSQLDQFMMTSAVANLKTVGADNKQLIIPLSMYYLDKADELVGWIKKNGHEVFSAKQIVIGLAEEVVNDHFDAAKRFFSLLSESGYAGMVYDIVDITSTQVTELDIKLIALSENCIGRMSRNISSEEMMKFPKLLEAMSQKGASVLAMGVNSPTSMTLVWEYNIPYACGNMIGSSRLELDFDFSQMMM